MALELTANDAYHDAVAAFNEMNLPLADSLCEELLEAGIGHPLVFKLAGQICSVVGEYRRASELLQQALLVSPGDLEIISLLDAAQTGALEQASIRPDARPRFLLIREWGFGFCSELDHVLGGLLLAEMTGREPIVYWGGSSLFRDEHDVNAWESFFEPVSDVSPHELVGHSYSFFPPKWNDANLFSSEVNRLQGYASRMAGFYFLHAHEEVAVTDVHFGILAMKPWIRPEHPLHGKSLEQLYQLIVRKHLRLVQSISAEVDAFVERHLTGRRSIAAHVRGGDKNIEDDAIARTNRQVLESTVVASIEWPDAIVFLLTDDSRMHNAFFDKLGDRVVSTRCTRVDSDEGLHYCTQGNKRFLGTEVVRDMFIAARCDRFIGAGTTNVASMILHLKDWNPANVTIHGEVRHYFRNHFLHRWQR